VKISEMVERARAAGACACALKLLGGHDTWASVAASPHADKWLKWASEMDIMPAACDPAWATCKAARDPAWATYEAACDPAWATCKAARDPAWATYEAACDAARATYKAACVAILEVA
jgi:hypothetical protein